MRIKNLLSLTRQQVFYVYMAAADPPDLLRPIQRATQMPAVILSRKLYISVSTSRPAPPRRRSANGERLRDRNWGFQDLLIRYHI